MESIMQIGYEFDLVTSQALLTLNQGEQEVRVFGHWGQTAYSAGTFEGELCRYCGGSIDRHSSVPMIEVDSARNHGPISDYETSQLEVKIDGVLLSVVGFACSDQRCKTRQRQAVLRVHQLIQKAMDLGVLIKDIEFMKKQPDFKNRPEELIIALFRSSERER
jgi:hypothetical protein